MKNKTFSIIFVSILCFNIFFLLFSFEFSPVRIVMDVDKLDNGDFIIIESISSSPLSIFTRGYIPNSRVIILDNNYVPYWEYDLDLIFGHEVIYMNNTNTVLIVDSTNNRVIEVAIENKSIVWEWSANKANWTKYNPDWADVDYIQNPNVTDWTHINHVNYIPERNSLLLSIRNFDMLIEIPYNESCYDRILWYYGEVGNYSKLNHQHNPEVLDNGNILICDSENDRIVEINYTTKEEVWIYNNNGNLDWPRDCDYIGSGKYAGCYLITDSLFSRIIVLEPISKTIQLILSTNLIVPYEADHIPDEDCFIVGNSFNTQFVIFNNQGFVVSSCGIPILGDILIINLSVYIIYYGFGIYKSVKKGKKITHRKNIERFFYIGLLLLCIFFNTLIFSVFGQKIIYPVMENIILR